MHVLASDDKKVKLQVSLCIMCRYHISRNVQTYSAIEEADAKLTLLDELLEQLELDA